MATVEQQAAEGSEIRQRGDGIVDTGEGIPVENPATGEIIATVPDLGAEAVAEMAARARAAQPEWEAYGYDGRARVLVRAQKWLMDNAERVVETIVSETGKTYEDAQLADLVCGQVRDVGEDLPRRGILDGNLTRLVAIRRGRLGGDLFLGTGHKGPSPS